MDMDAHDARNLRLAKARKKLLDSRTWQAGSPDVEGTRHSGGIWAESVAVNTTHDRAKKQACHPWFSDGMSVYFLFLFRPWEGWQFPGAPVEVFFDSGQNRNDYELVVSRVMRKFVLQTLGE